MATVTDQSARIYSIRAAAKGDVPSRCALGGALSFLHFRYQSLISVHAMHAIKHKRNACMSQLVSPSTCMAEGGARGRAGGNKRSGPGSGPGTATNGLPLISREAPACATEAPASLADLRLWGRTDGAHLSACRRYNFS